MKVNELRVGNWIYDDEGIYSKIVGTKLFGNAVSDENKNGSYVFANFHHKDEEASKEWSLGINELSPIPLTDEILLKCGFMDRGDSFIGHVFAKSFVYYITKRCDYFAFRMNTLNDQSVFIREVKYLHQLQNLYFAIIGEELEIEL